MGGLSAHYNACLYMFSQYWDAKMTKGRSSCLQGTLEDDRHAAAHMSLSDVVRKDSKARSSVDTLPDRLKAAGYDPKIWTKEPWKHMQRKEIPMRYDDQLEEDMYEDSQHREGYEAAVKPKPQMAQQAGAMQLNGQKVDADSVRTNKLAEAGTAVSTGSSQADRQQQIKGSKAARYADEDDSEGDQREQDSDKSLLGRPREASRGASLERSKNSMKASDSREAAVPREPGTRQKAGMGSRGYEGEGIGAVKAGQAGRAQGSQLDNKRDATADQRVRSKRSTADTKAQDGIPDQERGDRGNVDVEEEEIEEDEVSSRGGRHGQRPGASGDRGGSSSGSQSRDTHLAAAGDEVEAGSSSSARGKVGAASEPTARSSSRSRSSAAGARSGVAASEGMREGSSRKQKAAPAVRPALQGYNLSWTVLETEQEVNSELLSDDPTRWSWQPTAADQPGELSRSLWAIACTSSWSLQLASLLFRHPCTVAQGSNAASSVRQQIARMRCVKRQSYATGTCVTRPYARNSLCRPAPGPNSGVGQAQQQGQCSHCHLGQQRLS